MQNDFGVLSIDEELAMREHIMAIHDAYEQVIDTCGAQAQTRYSEVLARINAEPNPRVRSCTLRYPDLPRVVESDFRQLR